MDKNDLRNLTEQLDNWVIRSLLRELHIAIMNTTKVLVELDANCGITVRTKDCIICPPRAINKIEGEKGCREIVKKIKSKYPEIIIENIGFSLAGI